MVLLLNIGGLKLANIGMKLKELLREKMENPTILIGTKMMLSIPLSSLMESIDTRAVLVIN